MPPARCESRHAPPQLCASTDQTDQKWWQTPKLRGSIPTWVRPGRKAGATVADVQAAFEAGSVGGRAVNGDTLADAWFNLENGKRGEKELAPLPTSWNPSKSTRRRLQVAVGLHPDAAIGRELAEELDTSRGLVSQRSNFCAAGYRYRPLLQYGPCNIATGNGTTTKNGSPPW